MQNSSQTIELLAVLGRGLKEQNGKWFLTRDLERGNEQGMYCADNTPIDDTDPHCLIGGGELNLFAGHKLCRQYAETLKLMVCAYGARAPYLISADGPSESEIMTRRLFELNPLGPLPEVAIWPHDRLADGRSNTDRELFNIFELAVERGYKSVGIVTISIHYARSLLMAQRHLQNQKLSHLILQFFVSEDVLLRYDKKWEERVRKMNGSKAFIRSLFLEQRGINALLAGTYGK